MTTSTLRQRTVHKSSWYTYFMDNKRDKVTYKTFRPGKTREDYMPVDKRPRVEAARKRAERMRSK